MYFAKLDLPNQKLLPYEIKKYCIRIKLTFVTKKTTKFQIPFL
jgi:hypothetical protein